MGQEARDAAEARINIRKGDHGGSARERRCKKQWEFVHEIANRWTASRSSLINLARKKLLCDAQFVAEKPDLVRFRFEILHFTIGKNEVEQYKPRADEFKRMSAAIAEILSL